MKKKQRIRACWAAFGLILLFQANARAYSSPLVPVGEAAGIALETRGALIVGFSERSPAKDAGILEGDSILSADGVPISGSASLSGALADGKAEVRLCVLRGDETLEFTVTPDRSGETPRLGVFVRDALAGIGTVTYYDPETGAFGALGHGVNAPGTQTLLSVTEGRLVFCTPDEIRPGAPGLPGELGGTFDADRVLGTIESNTKSGIFGHSETGWTGDALPVAAPDEIKPGEALVRSAVSGEVRDYTVFIRAIRPADASKRDMLIEVTDPDLLALTGGIVRGMSGSPILQDGKLVGAVTHVLVGDPKKGYAIFMERMLAAAQDGAKTLSDAA